MPRHVPSLELLTDTVFAAIRGFLPESLGIFGKHRTGRWRSSGKTAWLWRKNLRHLFGDEKAIPSLVYFKVFLGVHQGAGVLTHGRFAEPRNIGFVHFAHNYVLHDLGCVMAGKGSSGGIECCFLWDDFSQKKRKLSNEPFTNGFMWVCRTAPHCFTRKDPQAAPMRTVKGGSLNQQLGS